MKITPLHIEILLYAHTRAIPMANWNAPATLQYTEELVSHQLIVVSSAYNELGLVYQTTERGQAWLEMILNTPFPVNSWVDPRTGKVLDGGPLDTNPSP